MATKRKTTTKSTPQNAPRRINFDKPEGHQIVYSNVIQVMHTPYDFQLTFGLVDASNPNSNNGKVKAVATIMLSPLHAKQLAHVLNQNVGKYEEAYMGLPLGPDEPAEGEFEIHLSEQPHQLN